MLTATSKYALRALSVLVREGRGATMCGHDIAARGEIPASYLTKILSVLKRAGILEATRGTGGGYRIVCDPHRVNLADVVELFEAPRATASCILDPARVCDSAHPCSAHAVFGHARESFLQFLDATTLAMIARAEPVAETPTTRPVARKADCSIL